MNTLKFLRKGVGYHINTFYSEFHALKAFYMICQQRGETDMNYFERF